MTTRKRPLLVGDATLPSDAKDGATLVYETLTTLAEEHPAWAFDPMISASYSQTRQNSINKTLTCLLDNGSIEMHTRQEAVEKGTATIRNSFHYYRLVRNEAVAEFVAEMPESARWESSLVHGRQQKKATKAPIGRHSVGELKNKKSHREFLAK